MYSNASSGRCVTESPKLSQALREIDPQFSEKMMPFLEALYRHYFRCEMSGWGNVPPGTVMFVGNHNGLLTFEVLMLFYAWKKRFGGSRSILGLAHEVALKSLAFRWLIPRLGAIPADPELAREALGLGHSLMVFPGGEKEAFRPYRDRKKLDFFQRKGFIKLAIRAGVPIVPIVSIGAHETYVILDRGEKLAEVLGLKEKLRLHGIPITLRSVFFAWCVATGLLTGLPLLLAPAAAAAIFVPLPAKMTFRILPPVDPMALWNPSWSEERNHQRIYDEIVRVMQQTLTEEYARRKLPVFG
ncbi:MAG: acyltransferase family protein [Oligoflexia bacterium]|nr:acyltransferase family protein [Oligoflexia bacterium]